MGDKMFKKMFKVCPRGILGYCTFPMLPWEKINTDKYARKMLSHQVSEKWAMEYKHKSQFQKWTLKEAAEKVKKKNYFRK